MTHSRHCSSGLESPPTKAFTLLELMLSMVLMATLLATAWSMLGIFRDRVEKAQTQTDHRHVVRGWQRLLERDLQLVLQPPREEAETAEGSFVDAESATSDRSMDSAGADGSSTSAIAGTSTSTGASRNADTNANPRTEPPLETVWPADGASAATAAAPFVSGDDAAGQTNRQQATDPFTGEAVRGESAAVAQWDAPEILLLGDGQSILLDIVTPAAPGPQGPPAEPPNLEGAAIPDIRRRVLYSFRDPLNAGISDQPYGLVRCELDPWSRLQFARAAGPGGLFTRLRPSFEKLGAVYALAAEPSPAATTDQADEDALAQQELLAGATNETQQPTPPDYLNLLDYSPDVIALQLRYHDGQSWRDHWDSRREQGKLPIAVELRFQLESDLPPRDDEFSTSPDGTAADQQPDSALARFPSTANSSFAPAGPADSDTRASSLEPPPEDHRYVILLRQPASPAAPSDAEQREADAPPTAGFSSDGDATSSSPPDEASP